MFVAGSIIAGNLLNIEEIIEVSEEAGLDWLHLDIMDGNFVPNITFGLDFVKRIRMKTKLPIDVHLMVLNPEKYLEYADFCDMLTFHIEATNFPIRLIESFRRKNSKLKVGIAFNPVTPVNYLENLCGYIDNVLIMSVEPGFAGQKFITNVLEKIGEAKLIISKWEKDIFLSVDGGINEQNYKIVLGKGANYLVCASYLYQDYSKIKDKVLLIKNYLKK